MTDRDVVFLRMVWMLAVVAVGALWVGGAFERAEEAPPLPLPAIEVFREYPRPDSVARDSRECLPCHAIGYARP